MISRNAPCVCGSGRRFKQCCGKVDAGFWSETAVGRLPSVEDALQAVAGEPQSEAADYLPPGIFADTVDLRELRSQIVKLPTSGEAKVIDAQSGKTNPQRITDTVALGPFQAQVTDRVRSLLTGPVARFYGVTIASIFHRRSQQRLPQSQQRSWPQLHTHLLIPTRQVQIWLLPRMRFLMLVSGI